MVILLNQKKCNPLLQNQKSITTRKEKADFKSFLKKLPEPILHQCIEIISKNSCVLDVYALCKIKKLLPMCKNIKPAKINVCYSGITGDQLLFQVSNVFNIKELNISYCTKLNDLDLMSILEVLKLNSPELEILNLSGSEISDTTLIKALKYFPCLETLSLNDCRYISNEGFNELLNWISNNDYLRSLSIAGLVQIDSIKITFLLKILKNMEEVNFSGLSQVNEKSFDEIFNLFTVNNPKIISFQAAETLMNFSHLGMIQNYYKELVLLNLSKCSLLNDIEQLKSFFSSYDSLKQISISELPINDFLLINLIDKNRSLQSINIAGCKEISGSGFIETCLLLERNKYPLKELNFASLKINAENLFSGLTCLLTCLNFIEKIDLSFLPINTSLLSLLSSECKNLKSLSLAGVKILDNELANFFDQLSLINSKLQVLNFNSMIFEGNSFGVNTFLSIQNKYKSIRHINIQKANFKEISIFSKIIETNKKFTSLFADIPKGISVSDSEFRSVKDVIYIIENDPIYFLGKDSFISKIKNKCFLEKEIKFIDLFGRNWLFEINFKGKILDFYGNWKLNSSELNHLLKWEKNIEFLDISSTCLNDNEVKDALYLLNEFSPDVRFLSLQNLCIYNDTLLMLFKKFPMLIGLDLSNIIYLDDAICDPFIDWIKNNPNLKHLGLPTSLSTIVIDKIIEATSNLDSFSLDGTKRCIHFTNNNIEKILENLSDHSPNLIKINLANQHFFSNHIEKLPKFFPKLIDLTLPGKVIENCGKIMSKLPNLKNLKFCIPTNEDFIKIAENNSDLTHLSLLALDHLNDESFKIGLALIGKKNRYLEALQMTAWTLNSNITSEAYLEGLKNIQNLLPNLKWLQLDSSNFDDNCLAFLAEHCKNLRQLNISGTKITGEGFFQSMKIIGEKNPIEFLALELTDLSGLNPSEKVLEPLIHNFNNLKFLSFSSGIGIESEIVAKMIPQIIEANPKMHSFSIFQAINANDLKKLYRDFPQIIPCIINTPLFSKGGYSLQWGKGRGIIRI